MSDAVIPHSTGQQLVAMPQGLESIDKMPPNEQLNFLMQMGALAVRETTALRRDLEQNKTAALELRSRNVELEGQVARLQESGEKNREQMEQVASAAAKAAQEHGAEVADLGQRLDEQEETAKRWKSAALVAGGVAVVALSGGTAAIAGGAAAAGVAVGVSTGVVGAAGVAVNMGEKRADSTT